MNETYESIVAALANDETVRQLGGSVWLATADPTEVRHRVAKFPVEVCPFGTSQVASAGALNLNGYFAVMLRSKATSRMRDGGGRDFMALGERVVELLHRSRHAGQSVIFSKNIVAHSTFTLENASRRIRVEAEEGEIVQVLFFWTNAASLAKLSSASSAGSGTGLSTSSASGAEDAAARAAVTAAAGELFP